MNKNRSIRVATFCLGLMLAGSLQVHAQKVTFRDGTVSLKQAFEKIEASSKYKIAYNDSHLNVSRKVSLNQKETEVLEILATILKDTGYTYKKNGNYIVIVPVEQKPASKVKKVKGVVKDASGEAIIGANVLVKGTTTGVITNLNGDFELEVPDNAVLQVTYIGYVQQDIAVKNRNQLTISLKEDTKTLDEVVVVGYGTMKKKDLTGAVASVKMDDTPLSTISTVSHALAGKAAGLQVNTVSAQPGGGTTFRIRGAASSTAAGNDPLIIIDGFPVSDPGSLSTGRYEDGNKDNILGSINPNDIESIEVLKDASSTAIYGARAGNGVIIVTTKRGKSGTPKVQYSGTASVQSMAKTYDMLSASDFMIQSNRYQKEEWMRTNKIGIYGGKLESEANTPYQDLYSPNQISSPTNDTNWFDKITRMGFQTSHNISITGGSEKTKYLVSGNFFKQKGVVKKNEMNRYTFRINLDQELSKFIKMGVNLTMSRNEYDNVPLGAGQNENASIMVSAAQFNPLLPIKDEDGDYVLNSAASFLPNPVSLLEITDKSLKDRLLATAFVEAEPIKALKLKANFGMDLNYMKRQTYLPKTTLYGQKEGGSAAVSHYDKLDLLMELTASYNKKIGDHDFGAIAGYSFQSFSDESLDGSNNRFLIDGFLYHNLGAGNAPKPGVGSSASRNEMASFFGRFNYSFKGRYLLTATLRADGASNFAKEHRWGYFPSVALGWRFVEESFMTPLNNVLSNGKFRVSYGETGNSNIGNRAISYYQVGNNYMFGDTETEYNGVYLSQLGNPDIKWETSRELNVGLDLGFLNGKINVTAEYFYKVISDLLSERTLLSYQEVDKIAANIGKTQSSGLELTINTNNINTRDFSWTTDLTFSFYRDKWKERDSSWKPSAYSIYHAPLRGSYGFLSDGLVQVGESISHMPGALPGQVKIKDIDGFIYNEDGSIKVDKDGKPQKSGKPDGKLNDADKVFYGSDDPGYLFGFNNTLRYKRFDLNIYMYGQFDKVNYGSYKDLWLTGSSGMTGIVNIYRGYNMPKSASEVWSHDNQDATRPGFFQDRSTWGIGDYYKQKSWFIRCRNITLGYNLPIKKNVLSNLCVYADVNNPFVITPYGGLDPETDNSTWAYPNVRSYSIGIDITF